MVTKVYPVVCEDDESIETKETGIAMAVFLGDDGLVIRLKENETGNIIHLNMPELEEIVKQAKIAELLVKNSEYSMH
jgi:hypothetical protein